MNNKYKCGDNLMSVDINSGHDSLTIVGIDTASPFSVDSPCYNCRLWAGTYSPGIVVKFQSELDKFYKSKGA